jgi:predicted neuraminidase
MPKTNSDETTEKQHITKGTTTKKTEKWQYQQKSSNIRKHKRNKNDTNKEESSYSTTEKSLHLNYTQNFTHILYLRFMCFTPLTLEKYLKL